MNAHTNNKKCGSGIQYKKVFCMQKIKNEKGTNIYNVNNIYCQND